MLASPVRGLIVLDVALLAVLGAGLCAPLSIPANPHVFFDPDPIAAILGRGWWGAARFAVLLLAAFALFWAALRLAARARGRSATIVVIAGAVVLALALLPLNAVTAADIFHNVADAWTFWLRGKDPNIYPPAAFPADPFLPFVPAWRSTPSAYGPVWYALSGLPLWLAGTSLWGNVIGQKLLVTLFLFGAMALAMLIARRAGANPLVAGVLVGWNPLLLWEAAGNGHNDPVTVCFALAALYAATGRRLRIAVFPLLALAIASKPALAVLGPPLLLWLWRTGRDNRRALLLSLALGGLTLVLCYAPHWEGGRTIATLVHESGHVSNSPGALLHTLIWAATGWNGLTILTGMRAVFWPLFLALWVLTLWRLRGTDVATLLSACFWTMLLFLTLVLWWFMPWYLWWLVPLAGPLGVRHRAVAAAFSFGGLLLYLPHMWLLTAPTVALYAATAAAGFVPLCLALLLIRPRRTAAEERYPLAAAAD